MSELPDVECFREYAEATSLHRTIERSSLGDERLLNDTTPQLLATRLKSREFTSARRHGKLLFLTLDSGAWEALPLSKGGGVL